MASQGKGCARQLRLRDFTLKRRRDTLRRDRRATVSLYGADIDVQMIESVARARVSVVNALET